MRSAFIFTGQGSQFAGMGKDLAEGNSVAREVFEEADEALGEPISRLCFEGPDEQLALTTHTQPATLVVSMAGFRAAGQVPDLAAGHSLGEYSALAAAGVFEFGDVVRLVRRRAQLMQDAVPIGAGGMVVLRKLSLSQAREVVDGIDAGVCEIANLNAPGQIVLSGETAAMKQVVERLGRNAKELAVSVPFHCSLLADAAVQFGEVLDDVEMRDPAFPIYCNVDAAPVTTADSAKDALKRQFAGSVLWQTTIERMIQDEGVRRFVEFGPKPTLSRMVAKVAVGIGVDDVEALTIATIDDLQTLRS